MISKEERSALIQYRLEQAEKTYQEVRRHIETGDLY